MLKKTGSFLLLIFLLAAIITAQPKTIDEKEKQAKLKQDAVAFLRETASETVSLRTLENRIGFNAELASLMWFHDEREARVMFGSVISDFRRMLAELDAQVNAMNIQAEDDELMSIPFFPDSSSQAKVFRRFAKTLSVRQQIASAISEHDALLAYAFYTDTAAAVTNAKFKKQIEQSDPGFILGLLEAIAEQNADKGLEFGRKSLADGLNYRHIELLKKIYAKDADKGAAFGEDIVRKLKSEDREKLSDLQFFNSILKLGIDNRETIKDKPTQKPVFSEQQLREVADLAARTILEGNVPEYYNIEETAVLIEKFLPGRAAQIRQKLKSKDAEKVGPALPQSAELISKAIKKRAEEQQDQEKLIEDLKDLDLKKLSDEDRAKAVAQAKTIINGTGNPSLKMMGLTGLAVQIDKVGDKETALQIMKEAETLVSSTPKNYLDYLQMWLLASGYAQIDADKSFPVMEDAVYRLNDTISAFIKVAEFIDVNGDFIEDGEVQVSGIGGGGIARQMIGGLGASEGTIKNLVEADFARTRALTNKFDRTEVRILAKMLILRTVLGNKKNDENENTDEFELTGK